MDLLWTRRNVQLAKLLLILHFSLLVTSCKVELNNSEEDDLDQELKNYVDSVFSVSEISIVPGVKIEEIKHVPEENRTFTESCDNARSLQTLQEYVDKKIEQFSAKHLLSISLPETARFFSSGILNLSAQLIKSVLIAMFLPSILGGLGKIVGKGLSTFSGISGASTGLNQHQQQIEDFEFKDVGPYNNEIGVGHQFNAEAAATNQLAEVDSSTSGNDNRLGNSANQRIAFVSPQSDNYYLRRPNRKTDYKVFHKIPSSSLLLTSYDPFYSPLLSRLDAIFQQLGLGTDKSPGTERCRERLVCMMYANPTKYAPYSNLVSAQLSRELNELRKPSSDNPDILRFFRYMKAAKDGQDGEECHAHGGCPSLTTHKASPAMLTTYNDINKLVLARNLK
ncbi:uncharacterized protein LOC114328052 isoform X2 [Diabrotica virgifera virgifera]|uniref:Uncharacterized protein LOC114328052 isoform X2 n=1 Tax=Diabrotica virgifera virgifera TaxID=50390 RepID=A0A6P7FCS3_DIAVI|nr:uncharacterized protein LOC114328052 isoform X2 [Diabrotica virgifera virgifera]